MPRIQFAYLALAVCLSVRTSYVLCNYSSVFCGSFLRSMKLMKSVVSLMCDFWILAIG